MQQHILYLGNLLCHSVGHDGFVDYKAILQVKQSPEGLRLGKVGEGGGQNGGSCLVRSSSDPGQFALSFGVMTCRYFAFLQQSICGGGWASGLLTKQASANCCSRVKV